MRPTSLWARRNTWRRLLLPLLATMFIVSIVTPAAAVHDVGLLELDVETNKANANAITDHSGDSRPDDWDRVCHTDGECPSVAYDDHADSRSFDADTEDGATGGTIFTTGASKDDLDVTGWKYTKGSVPDKDDLRHAFAARYDGQGSPTGSYLYFGADRFSTSGDAQIGFWFFQKKVGPNGSGGFTGEHTAADATHDRGDILALSNFTQGGGTPTIRVYEWVGKGNAVKPCVTADCSLKLLAGSTTLPAECAGSLSNDHFCAGVNSTNQASPWAFKAKGNASPQNTFIPGSFYEGGIDLGFLGLENECFSSFLAETRSSASADATLKDFVSGGFGACSATMTTTPSRSTLVVGGSLNDRADIVVSGTASPTAPEGSVDFYLCGPGVTSCDSSGTPFDTVNLSGATKVGNTYTVTSSNTTPLSAGSYCFYAVWAGDAKYEGPIDDGGSNECFTVTPKQPTISTNASGASGLVLGSSISDTATLGNTANQPDGDPAAGTITFRAYGPADDATTCPTPAVYTSVITVSGDGTYSSADGDGGTFTPTAPGYYNWIASYSGDSPNTSAVAGSCGDANESSLINTLQPAQTTGQWFYPNDSMTITVAGGGGNLAGTAHFTLYPNGTCDTADTPLLNDVQVAVAGPSGTTVSTANTTVKVDTTKTLSWKVSYTSTNVSHRNIAPSCNETSVVTINNG